MASAAIADYPALLSGIKKIHNFFVSFVFAAWCEVLFQSFYLPRNLSRFAAAS